MRRWRKVLTAACAAGMVMSSGTALAGVAGELSSPFGMNSSFIANFQTAANPFNPANTHVTSSDIAFWGDLAYVGDYGGFRIFDVSEPEPTLVWRHALLTPQGDPSVFDRDRDGRADTLVLSVDSVLAAPAAAPGRSPRRTASSTPGPGRACGSSTCRTPRDPQQIATVYQDCGSHTNTLLPAQRRRRCTC